MGLAALLGFMALQWPALPTPASGSDGARDAVVVAGTADLAFLPDIPGADLAATDWFRFFTVRGVPVQHVHLLRNAEVTREQLLDAVGQASRQVGEGGTLWLVFIGHGATGSDGDGLLIGVDAQPHERSLQARSVAQRELLATASSGGQGRTVAIFDACFSGVTPSGPLVPGAQFTAPVARIEPGRRTVIMAASDETAGPLPGHDRPAFSYLLLGALAGWGDADGDTRVTITEADAFVRATIQLAVKTRRQIPSVRGHVDDVVLATGATARAPDLGAILAAPSPSLPPPTLLPAPPTIRDASAHREAIAAYRERAIRLTPDKVWVRGPYATPLGDDDLVAAGEAGAPKAAKDLSDLATRAGSRELIWVLPPVGGMLLGATVGLVTGGVMAAASGTDNPDRNYLLGGFIGTFAGASVGALAVSLPLNSWATLDEDDKRRRDNARVELATAANDAERSRLGLNRADVAALDDTPAPGR